MPVAMDSKVADNRQPVATSAAQKKGWRTTIAGACAGASEVLATMPLDVIKTNMQIHPKKYKNPLHAGVTIYRESGVRALYYGMPAFLVQTAGKGTVRFTAFEQYKAIATGMLGVDGVKYAFALDGVAGFLAGMTEATIWTTPAERLKILRQNEVGAKESRYNTLLGSIRTVLSEQGISGLYRGLVPTALRQASSVGVRFMLFPHAKKFYAGLFGEKLPDAAAFMAGGTVGAISVCTNNPIDVVKSKMQSQSKGSGAMYTSSWQCAKAIMVESGPAGYFAGLSARVLRVFMGQAVTFMMYERILDMLQVV